MVPPLMVMGWASFQAYTPTSAPSIVLPEIVAGVPLAMESSTRPPLPSPEMLSVLFVTLKPARLPLPPLTSIPYSSAAMVLEARLAAPPSTLTPMSAAIELPETVAEALRPWTRIPVPLPLIVVPPERFSDAVYEPLDCAWTCTPVVAPLIEPPERFSTTLPPTVSVPAKAAKAHPGVADGTSPTRMPVVAPLMATPLTASVVVPVLPPPKSQSVLSRLTPTVALLIEPPLSEIVAPVAYQTSTPRPACRRTSRRCSRSWRR